MQINCEILVTIFPNIQIEPVKNTKVRNKKIVTAKIRLLINFDCIFLIIGSIRKARNNPNIKGKIVSPI